VCAIDGAKAPRTAAAAKRRLEEAAAREAVVRYGLPVNVSPIEAWLEEVRWTAGHVAWLRTTVQETEEQHLTVGVSEQKINPDGGKTVTIRGRAERVGAAVRRGAEAPGGRVRCCVEGGR
jgi:hypothetical protein